ncbi:hypothetical protein WS53_05845 [Burkholderia territorii]|nr:hypothetical protein WS53_05845 [Burkholderia territorii]
MRGCANAGFKGAGRPVRRTASADRMSCAGGCASARDIRNMQHEPGFRVAHLNEIEHARRTFEWSSRSTPPDEAFGGLANVAAFLVFPFRLM